MKAGIDYVGVGIGAAIINNEGKLFLALRGQKAKNERGKWETPGGGSELGETMEQTLKREMKEEYGFEVEPVELLHVVDHIIEEEGQHWVAITYICKVVKGTPKIMEEGKCDAIGWFTLEEAEKMPLSLIGQKDVADLLRKYPKGLPNLY